MPDAAEKLRIELRKLGARRVALRSKERMLAADTRKTVRRARGKVPMIEVAQLVGLDRTSVYQTYLNG